MTEAQAEVDQLFFEWVALRDRAWRTADPADGIAAGKAWGRYMRAFERFTTEQVNALVPAEKRNVVAFTKTTPRRPPSPPPKGGSAA